MHVIRYMLANIPFIVANCNLAFLYLCSKGLTGMLPIASLLGPLMANWVGVSDIAYHHVSLVQLEKHIQTLKVYYITTKEITFALLLNSCVFCTQVCCTMDLQKQAKHTRLHGQKCDCSNHRDKTVAVVMMSIICFQLLAKAICNLTASVNQDVCNHSYPLI